MVASAHHGTRPPPVPQSLDPTNVPAHSALPPPHTPRMSLCVHVSTHASIHYVPPRLHEQIPPQIVCVCTYLLDDVGQPH